MSDAPEISTPEVADVEPAEVTEVDDTADAEEAEYHAKMAEIAANSAEEADEEPELSDDDKKYKAKMKKIEDAKKKKAAESEEAEEKPKTTPKKEAPKEKKIWKLKVNDKEIEFDATDDEVVKAEVQKGRAAEARFQQAATIRKQAENFVEVLRTDPIKALSHPSLGIDLKKMCEEYLYENVVKAEMMSPEERKQKETEAELERYRQREAQEKKERETKTREDLKEKYRQDWTVKFKEAIEAHDLPRTDWVMNRMAHYMKVAIAKGHKVQPTDVAPLVRKDLLEHTTQLFTNTDGEKLMGIIGKDAFDKIRKANLKKLGVEPTTKADLGPESSQRTRTPEKRYGSKEEMMRDMRKD